MDSKATTQFPKIDFSELELNNPGTQAWHTVRSQVIQALDTVGFFQAVFDKVTPALRDELFGPTAKALFNDVPQESRQRNASDKPYQGYINRRPGINVESCNIDNANRLDSVQAFAHLMWPQGNPAFCDTVSSFANQLSELELMVRRMVLESLGVENHYASHLKSTKQTLRIAEYGPPDDQETMIAMNAHNDMNLVTIICQHDGDGLEVMSKGGEWFHASPNTYTVMTGESFQAWTNGRLKPTLHRVRMTSNKTRYSIGYGSQFNDGCMIQAPEELASDESPKLFKPYEYVDYLHFLFSDQGRKAKCALKAFCGVNGDEVAV